MFPSGRNHEYELVGRTSTDVSNGILENEETLYPIKRRRKGIAAALISCLKLPFRRIGRGRRSISRVFSILIGILGVIVVFTPIFNPSYSKRPSHYSGTNVHKEKVFIAANIVDKDLIRGAWGDAVLGLIDIIGPENTFLSIYENDSGPETKEALKDLEAKVKCRRAIVSGHIDLADFPTVQLLPNEHRVKRITYLAAVRNHALDPLDAHYISRMNGDAPPTDGIHFDRLLFLNDVVFSPKDAADLLFATNAGETGKADYQATCAMDYINPIKFYDRFAMRDSEAYEVGVPFYPWFTRNGGVKSWQAVMAHSDAVPVKSCWGGMVAFEARWFLKSDIHNIEPLEFRSESETFWDASECCLIHADLQHNYASRVGNPSAEAKIFVNPFIRVAYDSSSFGWLEFTRRFEKLYTIPHIFISWILGMPWGASRRLEVAGNFVERQEWAYTGPNSGESMAATTINIARFGHWKKIHREAKPGGFCGFDFLLALKNERKPGERMWEKISAPEQ